VAIEVTTLGHTEGSSSELPVARTVWREADLDNMDKMPATENSSEDAASESDMDSMPAQANHTSGSPDGDSMPDMDSMPAWGSRIMDISIRPSLMPGSAASGVEWPEADMEKMLQNTLVVVIGTGKKVCTLAERRLHEKGRLLVLLTDRAPARTYDDDGGIRWFPPNRKPPVGEQARQMVHKFNSYAA